ncbi:MAG: hypothetical protein COV75_01205 [Candidatus Omnitrophica bacterium CG11_big_fil_rev_8_21_14_0_20_63_9]|nr:MAG: hypothetical protein COV75_01205 [Candidatus Omnitrophica bacterium CG11_big_fil_rev_8_21_14_0_20_63_9]
MTIEQPLDTQELWRRVGLEQLRNTLGRISRMIVEFEEVLRSLPSCNECARSQLIQQLNQRSTTLSAEFTTLAVLAEGLQQAVAQTEAAHGELLERIPSPCHCASHPCTCHGR